jgi:hypothetical protein
VPGSWATLATVVKPPCVLAERHDARSGLESTFRGSLRLVAVLRLDESRRRLAGVAVCPRQDAVGISAIRSGCARLGVHLDGRGRRREQCLPPHPLLQLVAIARRLLRGLARHLPRPIPQFAGRMTSPRPMERVEPAPTTPRTGPERLVAGCASSPLRYRSHRTAKPSSALNLVPLQLEHDASHGQHPKAAVQKLARRWKEAASLSVEPESSTEAEFQPSRARGGQPANPAVR